MVRLAAIFSDGMVLQRHCPVPVWGWAHAGAVVSISLSAHADVLQAVADAQGCWRVTFPAMPAGGPYTLVVTVAGTPEQIVVSDVLVGEVWLCSGQSNMAFELKDACDGAVEIAAANAPQIRQFCVDRRTAPTPASDVSGSWKVCSPETAGRFSAVGYFFARELHTRLGVPVGLVNTSWGGSPVEAWISLEGVRQEPALAGHARSVTGYSPAVEAAMRQAHVERRRAWLDALPQDRGNLGLAQGWAVPTFPDAGWGEMTLPCEWQQAGHPHCGVFWFRRTVEIPAAWQGQDLCLSLGAVDKTDESYFNGTRIGGINWVEQDTAWSMNRRYTIPAALVQAGEPNLIAVRVISNYSDGGMTGPTAQMTLTPAGMADAPAISLAGPWRYQVEQNFGKVPRFPREPVMPPTVDNRGFPTVLFNAMLAPLIPYALRGVLWYQGEANAERAAEYQAAFPALVRDWRQRWGQEALPVHFVQLPNFGYCRSNDYQPQSVDSRWAELREAQALSRAQIPNSSMVVTIDVGDERDLHPRNKQPVGWRLAQNALALTYGLPVEHCGPRYLRHTVVGGELCVEFAYATGLCADSGTMVTGFVVAGADRVFHPAVARLEGAAVWLTSPAVLQPVAARYGWANAPICACRNAAGLPMEPFRTDTWPTTQPD